MEKDIGGIEVRVIGFVPKTRFFVVDRGWEFLCLMEGDDDLLKNHVGRVVDGVAYLEVDASPRLLGRVRRYKQPRIARVLPAPAKDETEERYRDREESRQKRPYEL